MFSKIVLTTRLNYLKMDEIICSGSLLITIQWVIWTIAVCAFIFMTATGSFEQFKCLLYFSHRTYISPSTLALPWIAIRIFQSKNVSSCIWSWMSWKHTEETATRCGTEQLHKICWMTSVPTDVPIPEDKRGIVVFVCPACSCFHLCPVDWDIWSTVT